MWTHEGGIATPLIAHWPRGIAARGELRRNPGHVIDIVPTLMALAGGRLPGEWESLPVPEKPGKSLVPVFARDGSVSRDYFWWMHEGNRALRRGDWKIVSADDRAEWGLRLFTDPAFLAERMAVAMNAPWELYDLSTDPVEARNLAGAQPDKVNELARLWEKEYERARMLALQDSSRAGER